MPFSATVVLAGPRRLHQGRLTVRLPDGSTSALGFDERFVRLWDFFFATETEAWPNIDDVVMGGVSSSVMIVDDGVASFTGSVSFDNNGGFASVRGRRQRYDLSGYAGFSLRLRGDGTRYGVRIRTGAAFDGVSYQADLTPPADEWTDAAIPFADFVPVYRGSRLAGHPPLDPSKVVTFGFIISRQEGSFRLDIAHIRGFRTRREEGSDS
jgi:monofunctional biosynthetic peptidoglycan transglycosylase